VTVFVLFGRKDYRSMLSAGRQSTSFSSMASPPSVAAQPRRYCDTTKLIWGLMIAIALTAFIWAVIHNMEPAFVNPLMQ